MPGNRQLPSFPPPVLKGLAERLGDRAFSQPLQIFRGNHPFRRRYMSVKVRLNSRIFLLSMDEFLKLVQGMTLTNPVEVLDFM